MDIIRMLEKTKRRHFILRNGRIHCTLTGHELPPSADTLLAYAGGKKFDKALTQWTADCSVPEDYRRYLIDAELVEQSSGQHPEEDGEERTANRRRLFCQLTCRFVSDTAADVVRHTSGRRFHTALLAYKSARAVGQPFEPNTSLYKKYRSKMTLEGLANAGKMAAVEDSDSELDSAEESAEIEENDDEDKADEAVEEEMLEELEQPPLPKQKLKRKAEQKVEASSDLRKKKRRN